jgi:hypothetical protein
MTIGRPCVANSVIPVQWRVNMNATLRKQVHLLSPPCQSPPAAAHVRSRRGASPATVWLLTSSTSKGGPVPRGRGKRSAHGALVTLAWSHLIRSGRNSCRHCSVFCSDLVAFGTHPRAFKYLPHVPRTFVPTICACCLPQCSPPSTQSSSTCPDVRLRNTVQASLLPAQLSNTARPSIASQATHCTPLDGDLVVTSGRQGGHFLIMSSVQYAARCGSCSRAPRPTLTASTSSPGAGDVWLHPILLLVCPGLSECPERALAGLIQSPGVQPCQG